jgi:hypothetical protein
MPKKEIQEAQRTTQQARDRFVDPRERIDPTSLDKVTPRIAQRIAMQKESVSKQQSKKETPALLVERDNKECGNTKEDVPLVLDDDDSLCGIEFIDDECEEDHTSNFKYVSFPTPLSRRRSDASDDDDDSSALSPGILLSPKRAIGNNNIQQHRHVSFSPPNHQPRIHTQNPKQIVSKITESKSDESFLERMFGKMFVCGGMNNAVDFDSY